MDLAKFNKFIEPKFNEKFAWGSNDCNTLILEYLDYMLGTETLKIAYKKYHTKFGAMKFQKKYQQRVSEKCLELGLTAINPTQARHGDILIKTDPRWDMCHLSMGTKFISIDEVVGVSAVPIPDFNIFDKAFRLPC